MIDIAPYASGGLSSYFDATNPASFEGNTWKDISGNGGDITLANSPTINQDGINFNDTNQYARSATPLDFSTLNAITIEVRFKLLSATSSGLLFEHTRDWNTNTGGLGVSLNGDGHQYLANSIHTVHNISGAAAGANNYVVPQTDMQSHTITNTFSAVSNPTGRLLYYDGQLVSPSGKYTAGQAIRGPLKNDYLYFGSRNGSGSFANVAIQSVRIYNKQLSASEVCNNAWIDYANFGGAIPNCQQ